MTAKTNDLLTPIRRVIAAIDTNHHSKILSEETIPASSPYSIFPSFQIQELFYTENVPQTFLTRHLDKGYNIELPKGAMRIKMMRIPTTTEMAEALKKAGQPVPIDWSTYNLHNTDSIDYMYIVSGSVNYVVEKSSTRLNTGDFLVQLGPTHIFVNDGDVPCIMLCVMIGTEPSQNRKKMAVE